MAPYFTKHGYCVRAVNFLDMAHSDGWNCLYSLDQESRFFHFPSIMPLTSVTLPSSKNSSSSFLVRKPEEPRPSAYLEKLEDKLAERLGPWFERHKAKFPVYIPLGLLGWYFYGMFLNSIRLGTAATFRGVQAAQIHVGGDDKRAVPIDGVPDRHIQGRRLVFQEAIMEVTDRPPVPYTPPRTQFLTEKGEGVGLQFGEDVFVTLAGKDKGPLCI